MVTSHSLEASEVPSRQEAIAVVGLSCRLPGTSDNPNALWDFLERGGIAQNTPPDTRFNFNCHYDGSTKPKTMRSPGGMFLENVDLRDIDAQFFGLSRTEAIAMDPQQRQLLEVVYEGLENAGISLEALSGQSFGCFVGSYASDYADIQARDPENRAPLVTIGVGRAMLSNRISHFLNIKGSSMTLDTACSGSLVAVHVACRFLHSREIDGAIVAGCNLYLNPEHNMDFGAMKGASSMSGRCHTFDAKADGYIKSEGVNAVILKRLQDALRDGDPIRAIIRGSASNSNGYTPGIASPSAEAQASAIRKAYANAGIQDFGLTGYLECHGTGTQKGDPVEVAGASSVFASARSSSNPLFIGSIKSNIGHSEPASGLAGLLKAVFAVEKGLIPGNPTFQTPNPESLTVDFEALRVQPSKTLRPWPDLPIRRASVNSFGYGGSNAHVVLDETYSILGESTRRHASSFTQGVDDIFAEKIEDRNYLLALSANDLDSLRSYIRSLNKHLLNPAVNVKLRDLAYTLAARRSHHFYRAYCLTKEPFIDEADMVYGKRTLDHANIGFVFTGQGAQWSQMGLRLIQTFPAAQTMLQRLEKALESISPPPRWSLGDELSQPRSTEHLRLPEFSQPLVTAIQLIQVAVLEHWGIRAQSVVGHSSGEIAAAYSAGWLTAEEAIIVAYYRGQAASQCRDDAAVPVGMLAVGLSPDECRRYFDFSHKRVQISCFNSPRSITLSGCITDLEDIKTRLQKDGHFARLLQVDLAYHSTYMAKIGLCYEELLKDCHLGRETSANEVRMFSSVTGSEIRDCNVNYWKTNLISPVQFESAIKEMLTADSGLEFLLEVGPSDSLSGPISQIKKSMVGPSTEFEYCSVLRRGPEATDALLRTVGRLHIAGHKFLLSEANRDTGHIDSPKIIIDLPNYAWNHSTKYWFESAASTDWRFRKFKPHDLLGSKIPGTAWTAPSWKMMLNVSDVPWIKDHKMGHEIVLPAAAYISMAVESMYQAYTFSMEDARTACEFNYKLINVKFVRALVLQDSADKHELLTTLMQCQGGRDGLQEFKICSQVDGSWVVNCHGLIAIKEASEIDTSKSIESPLSYPETAKSWYKAMEDAGYGFGPTFRKQIDVEVVAGHATSRSTLDLAEPVSPYLQSTYPMHPVNIDACLQSGAPSLWLGHRSAVDAVVVPAMIDSIVINSRQTQPSIGVATTSRDYVGIGRLEEPTSFRSDIQVRGIDDGAPLLRVSGLRYRKIDTRVNLHLAHNYTCAVWKPDITFLTRGSLDRLTGSVPSSGRSYTFALSNLHEIIDFVAHKKPTLKVLEVNMTTSESESLWLSGRGEKMTRTACRHFSYGLTNADRLLDAQARYAVEKRTEVLLLDPTRDPKDSARTQAVFDLVIIRGNIDSSDLSDVVIKNLRPNISQGGHVLLVDSTGDEIDNRNNVHTLAAKDKPLVPNLSMDPVAQGFRDNQFECLARCTSDPAEMRLSFGLAAVRVIDPPLNVQQVQLFRFSKSTLPSQWITDALKRYGWQITDVALNLSDYQQDKILLVLDELNTSLLPTVSDQHWELLKNLVGRGLKVLWVTAGSQINTTDPNNALIHGLARTVRAENPGLHFVTLDVEAAGSENTPSAIDRVLAHMRRPVPKMQIDNEFVERKGIIYVGRIYVDDLINKVEKDHTYGTDIEIEDLHTSKSCIRLRCERLGIIDSLQYAHVAAIELPLEAEHFVEAEIFAAGLNFKDIAVVMGIVPEDEYLLGLEGAGVIRRVGSRGHPYRVGQRVLVYRRGTIANRVQVSKECIHLLPDEMTYEEAATLACTYLSSIYALFDKANVSKGQRVLIHSAAGGVGIAAIQLCQYVGAEVFATVGTTAKREFLRDTFGIPNEHIFSSRSTKFFHGLMQATNGKGVDIVLNSLTGDLLAESWRCVADGGTMVEIGKKDILDRNTLSMEPFGRNASFQAIDMSHTSMSDATNARLLSQIFSLISKGAIRPIRPVTVYAFQDVQAAFRYMRTGQHIGKIVLSSGAPSQIKLPVRRPQKKLTLRADLSYLIVGGLKGLCGSLALYMARCGARYLVIMSRSGYADDKSQRILTNLYAMECHLDLIVGDVAESHDVEEAYKQAARPIGGVIQGAMVLQDRSFELMTVDEFRSAIRAKVQGTWNLHSAALARGRSLEFFTMLSSISGVVGQKGQANYSAANVFLDSFARYRQTLGLAACTVDLGVIEDVGYAAERAELAARLDNTVWVSGINESLLHKILALSILQQTAAPINPATSSQLITGIPVPQREDSMLLRDARFASLAFGDESQNNTPSAHYNRDSSRDVQAIMLLVKNKADRAVLRTALLEVINDQVTRSLGLDEAMEPTKALASYGLDSLGAVEIRNWIRIELGAELTTLEVTHAKSLSSLCERVAELIST